MENLTAGLSGCLTTVFTSAAFSHLCAYPLVSVVTNITQKGSRVGESNLPTDTMFGLLLLWENLMP